MIRTWKKRVLLILYFCKPTVQILYRVYQKNVDKSEIALYLVKRFNVRTFLLK